MADFGDIDPMTGLTSARTAFEGTEDPYAYHMTPEEAREYHKKRRRAALLGFAGTIGGMGAAGLIPMAFGGGATGAGSSAAATSAASAGSSAAAPAGVSFFEGVTAPTFGAATSAGTGAAAGAGAVGTGATVAGLSKAPLIADIGKSALGAILGVRSDARSREVDERKLALDRELALLADRRARDLAADENSLEESKLDPFRALMAQIDAATRLDRLLNTDPLEMDFSESRPGHFAPRITGGAARYQPSATLRPALETARQATLTGTGANGPATSTNRAQQVMDLLAASAPPRRAPVSTTLPVRPPAPTSDADYLGGPTDLRPSFDDTIQPSRRMMRPRRLAVSRPRVVA